MKDSEKAKDWYDRITATYNSEQRKNWYSEVADAYNRVRPCYPKELVNRAVALAQLPSDATILEIGSGPGNATIAFAKLGFSMVCLEPSQAACEQLQQNCASYPLVKIHNTLFEEWLLEANRFDAVLAANSWHWLPPEIRCSKAAAALKKNGSLVLLWNMSAQPVYEVYQALNEVCQTQAPSVMQSYEDRNAQEEILKGLGQDVMDSKLFSNVVCEQVACEVAYSVDDYLTLLNTFSPYRMLDPQTRESLFERFREVLEKACGTSIPVSYLSAFHVAQKPC
jgi:SAM-dependent methyltransferase